MNPIPYGRQSIEAEDIEAVTQVLKGDYLTQGPTVKEFETSITNFLKKITGDQTEVYAHAVNNGTTALHLACLALGLKPGEKVLVTSNTFAASANCVLYCGGEVEFVDISPKDYCIDFKDLENTLKNSPAGTYKGIIAVDFAGHVLDLEKLKQIADQHKLWIIEDACHAIGGTRKALDGTIYAAGDGKYADMTIYSFHPVKHIATGEGGMILTRSKKLHERLNLLRTHGITKDPSKLSRSDGGWYHEMQELGYNGRISDVLCALGTSQMKRIEQNLANRRKIAKKYREGLMGLPIELPQEDPLVQHAFHLYVILTDKRKELYDYLHSKKIFAQVHYLPIYQHPYYIKRYGKISKPNCDHYYERCLSIPMYHGLTEADQNRVISEIRNFFQP